MEAKTHKSVTLRNGTVVGFSGKGVLGRILVGSDQDTGKPICWHLSGRWRWDDQDHPIDIIDGYEPERNRQHDQEAAASGCRSWQDRRSSTPPTSATTRGRLRSRLRSRSHGPWFGTIQPISC